ncbi:MAG: hypothetical protein FWH55_14165 [Oscillospiraceae bacterium]|nr:hypothetical protein [Oscillospiraceae bacterium]
MAADIEAGIVPGSAKGDGLYLNPDDNIIREEQIPDLYILYRTLTRGLFRDLICFRQINKYCRYSVAEFDPPLIAEHKEFDQFVLNLIPFFNVLSLYGDPTA